MDENIDPAATAIEENVAAGVVTALDAAPDGTARRSRCKDITREMRRAKAIERATKNTAAWTQLQVKMQSYREDIEQIARENGVSANVLKRKAMHVSAIKPSRKTNNYNAYRRFKKLDLKSHNFNMSQEQRNSLIDLQSLPVDEGYELFKSLADDIKDIIVLIHDQYRLSKMANKRSTRKSIGQSFRHSIGRISAELKSLSSRCQTSAICIVVRASTSVTHDPFVYTDNVTKKFFSSVLNMNLNTTTERLEGYAIQGMKGALNPNSTQKRLNLKTEVRNLLRTGLREASGDEKATLRFADYEVLIVERYGVRLTGWPADLSFNLDAMSHPDLERIKGGLDTGTIAWEECTVSSNRVCASTRKHRKARSDKGKKRPAYKKRRVFGEITNQADSVSESEDSSDGDTSSSESDSSSDSDSDESSSSEIEDEPK